MYIYERTKKKDGNFEFTGYMVDEASIINDNIDYSSVYRSKEFTECMKYFDNTDTMTRKVLLTVNEADQEIMMHALANKLYGHVVNKVDDVDFGTIPNSRGNVEKIDHYEQLTDCINVLSQVLQAYNQPVQQVDTVSIALANIVDRKDLFMRAYKLNAELPIITYNTMVLSVVGATSLLISSHIEFIKMADNKGYDIAFDKASRIKSQDKLLFRNLENFNKMCSSGDFDKTMEFALRGNVNLKSAKHESGEIQDEAAGITIGSIAATLNSIPTAITGAIGTAATTVAAHPVIVGIVGTILGLIFLIKVIRWLIYYFYYSRTKVSDYCEVQSALLYMNATNVQNSLTHDEKERKKIAEKQSKIAKFFSDLADKIKVKDRTAEAKASSDTTKLDNEKFKYNEVIDGIPDSSNAALF